MPEALLPWMHVAGRILFALVFVMLTAGHFTQLDASTAYAASKKLPAPKAAVLLSGVMAWTGALLVALGWHRFIGAGLLVLFLVPTTLLMHNYWTVQDPMARMGERINFWKNIGLLGAALFVAYYARFPWPMSLGG